MANTFQNGGFYVIEYLNGSGPRSENWKHHKLAKWGNGDKKMGTHNSQELLEDQVIIFKTLYSGRF